MRYVIFGESHGPAIGVVLEGVPAGLELDLPALQREMARRAPGQNAMSTARREADEPQVLSGVFENRTTGTPLCAVIQNTDTRSRDYSKLRDLPRPGHADYSGAVRYGGYNDYRGGGHFSGRLTAPMVFAGAVARQLGFEGYRIGDSVAPGVPVMVPLGSPQVRVVYKSGNFGEADFFEKALAMTGPAGEK